MKTPHKAVVLARGLGSRMRRAADDVELSADQVTAADAGVKAMVSTGGRPFLDYVISSLADVGFTDICLVIGPEHDIIRNYYSSLKTERVTISFAIQEKPIGTANAILAAEEFAGNDRILVLNSDNYYPVESLRRLTEVSGSGLIGFNRRELIANSNFPPERVAAFAIINTDADGYLTDLIEKPDPETYASFGDDVPISMNCWLCEPAIFPAARSVPLSARGEYEIPDAIRAAVRSGDPYRVVPSTEGVLDMSSRKDISSVAAALREVEVRL